MERANSSWLHRSQALAAALLGFVLILAPITSVLASEYRVNIGDVLELSAASIPEFRHRGTVAVSGEVSFPLVGEIPARNKSINEILKVIQERVPQKVLRRRALDGSEHDVVIDGDEVSLTIAEYSPIYVNGDVATPGSYPYRPGLTVLQAIALAGGYDTMRTRMENPYLLAVDLQSERETLMNEIVRQQARIARVQAELGRDSQESDIPAVSPVGADTKALEVERLDVRKSDFEKERQHLTEAVQSLSVSLDLLGKQMQTEAERAKIDQEELERVEGLAAKGMATVVRVSDMRRLVLLSASRATEIEARFEQVKQQRADEQRKLQKLFDERRIGLLKELQDAKLELAAIVSKVSAVTQKMFMVGAIRSQLGRGGTGAPELVVVRRTDQGSDRLVATAETELLPRDVVEVALQLGGYSSNVSSHHPVIREHLGSLERSGGNPLTGLPN
ncbi:polysaccharide biosynthesis/export family protein [Microvirga sp. TS319]|uniref:polysaccharide biosynthesis/export family protein n=1 Tax=Microvirga sp. TS319 TaxID=3241165 RepID=UPI00351A8669